MKIKKLSQTAIFAALIFVATVFTRIPVPATNGGYVNFGDTLIYISAYFLGIYAIPAAAIGSIFADLFVGATIYAPATFIIKGIMGLSAFWLIKKANHLNLFLTGLIGGAIMTVGYMCYEMVVFGASYAIFAIPYNVLQWAASGVVLFIVLPSLKKITANNKGDRL